MVFTSLEFCFLFFPIVLFAFLLIKPEFGNGLLLMSSLIFYYIGAKEQILLLIIIIGIAYVGGVIESITKSVLKRKIALTIAVSCMILTMAYYKYYNFVIYNVNTFFSTNIKDRSIALPIGISFFVFQAISYVVDVYRGEQALVNPIDMGLYIAFFPQLIAGPIVRFCDVREYLNKKYRNINSENIVSGIWIFVIGFNKKVLLANNLGGLVNLVFGVTDISQFSVLYTWLGAIAYTLQIYYDFSGYSDMAIGLGKIFVFEFQKNFYYPYCAKTIKDFWHRWHISLSQFFRDYVYIPLGGNRCTKTRWVFNILVVWFLTGLWHGASWNYIIWGVSYGILLLIERFVLEKLPHCIMIDIMWRLFTLSIVIVLWVVFKCEHISMVIKYLKNMFGIGTLVFIDNAFIFQIKNFWFLILVSIMFCLPLKEITKQICQNAKVYNLCSAILLFICFISSISYIYMGSYNPFLYFMF